MFIGKFQPPQSSWGVGWVQLNSRELHHSLHVRTVKESDLIPGTEAGDRSGWRKEQQLKLAPRTIPTASPRHPPGRMSQVVVVSGCRLDTSARLVREEA
jgi:hypothetical protein